MPNLEVTFGSIFVLHLRCHVKILTLSASKHLA